MNAMLKRLREERGQMLADVKKIVDKAETETRELSGEERQSVDKLLADAETRKADITRIEQATALDEELAKRGNGGNNRPGRDEVNPETRGTFDPKDLRGYSLVKAIRQRMNNQPLDGIEREVSDELAKRAGKSAQGFYFPTELALESRALDLTAGAGAKPTVTDPANFIELLREQTVISQLGARLLTGLTGDLSLPKQTGGATAYWVTEGNAPTGSNATIGQVGLAPKTVGAYTDLSRKFIIQSSISAEQFVREDLARVLAIAIDRAAIAGSGTGAEPLGLLNNSGISAIALGTNGAALTYANLVAMETAVAASNADIGSLAYLTNPKVRGRLKTTDRGTDTGKYIWADDNTVNGYRALASNLVPSNLTKGSANGTCSAAIFGNFNDLILGFWSALDVLVDPYTGSSSGTVRVVALQDCDIKVRHTESFSRIVDILP